MARAQWKQRETVRRRRGGFRPRASELAPSRGDWPVECRTWRASDAACDVRGIRQQRRTPPAVLKIANIVMDCAGVSSPYVHVVMPADATASFAGKDALGMKLARADANGR